MRLWWRRRRGRHGGLPLLLLAPLRGSEPSHRALLLPAPQLLPPRSSVPPDPAYVRTCVDGIQRRRGRLVHKSTANPALAPGPRFFGLQGTGLLSGGLERLGGSPESSGPRSQCVWPCKFCCRSFFSAESRACRRDVITRHDSEFATCSRAPQGAAVRGRRSEYVRTYVCA